MKFKGLLITIILSIMVIMLYVVDNTYKENYDMANKAFLVYLDGEKIGLIDDDQALYDLINKEQQEIKNKYGVDSVYPPSGFKLTSVNTYNEDYLTVNEIYEKIENVDEFTIKGYKITIKYDEESEKKSVTLNVLDKSVFEDAVRKFILAFITEDELNKYLSDVSKEITEIGSIINKMYFNETITIKEDYIKANDKIYTDVDSLSQYLLFGEGAKMDSYTVKLGDNIESISEEYKINPQEFIIANPIYRDSSSMLKVGAKVNVTLLNPVLTLVYEMHEISEKITEYKNKVVVDTLKSPNYSEVTTAGVNGISLDHISYQVVNGEASSEVRTISRDVIREMVEQVTTVGRKYTPQGSYIDIKGDWGLPTNSPYYVTSPYGWRSHKMHFGVDISGTGYGSPIYSVADGTVVEVAYRSTDGYYVIIEHDNNIFTQYAHMAKQLVSVGQSVKRGDKIGLMGNSGLAFGTHLHFGVSVGWPYHGDYSFRNPSQFIKL